MKPKKKRVHFKLTAEHQDLIEAMRGNWTAAAFITDQLEKLLTWFEANPKATPPAYGRQGRGEIVKNKELGLSLSTIKRIEKIADRLSHGGEKPTLTQFVALALDRAKTSA